MSVAALLFGLMASLAATPAHAQASFPSGPVRILVPFAAGGPTDVVARILPLSADIRAIVESEEFAAKTRHLGIFPKGNTPEELDAWMQRETARWAEIAKAANIKAD
jgi:tripartite-type tricarboxylate transporter receptor subunit TctC